MAILVVVMYPVNPFKAYLCRRLFVRFIVCRCVIGKMTVGEEGLFASWRYRNATGSHVVFMKDRP